MIKTCIVCIHEPRLGIESEIIRDDELMGSLILFTFILPRKSFVPFLPFVGVLDWDLRGLPRKFVEKS